MKWCRIIDVLVLIKNNERRLAVTETKMLPWNSGVTGYDIFQNEDIRGRHGVVPIIEKLREEHFG